MLGSVLNFVTESAGLPEKRRCPHKFPSKVVSIVGARGVRVVYMRVAQAEPSTRWCACSREISDRSRSQYARVSMFDGPTRGDE